MFRSLALILSTVLCTAANASPVFSCAEGQELPETTRSFLVNFVAYMNTANEIKSAELLRDSGNCAAIIMDPFKTLFSKSKISKDEEKAYQASLNYLKMAANNPVARAPIADLFYTLQDQWEGEYLISTYVNSPYLKTKAAQENQAKLKEGLLVLAAMPRVNPLIKRSFIGGSALAMIAGVMAPLRGSFLSNQTLVDPIVDSNITRIPLSPAEIAPQLESGGDLSDHLSAVYRRAYERHWLVTGASFSVASMASFEVDELARRVVSKLPLKSPILKIIPAVAGVTTFFGISQATQQLISVEELQEADSARLEANLKRAINTLLERSSTDPLQNFTPLARYIIENALLLENERNFALFDQIKSGNEFFIPASSDFYSWIAIHLLNQDMKKILDSGVSVKDGVSSLAQKVQAKANHWNKLQLKGAAESILAQAEHKVRAGQPVQAAIENSLDHTEKEIERNAIASLGLSLGTNGALNGKVTALGAHTHELMLQLSSLFRAVSRQQLKLLSPELQSVYLKNPENLRLITERSLVSRMIRFSPFYLEVTS